MTRNSPTKRIVDALTTRPDRRFRTLEALSLAGTLVALWITFFLWDLAVVEHNFVSGWLIETVGWYATAGLALTVVGLAFVTLWLAHSWYPSRWWLAVAGGVSLVHVGNAVNDLYVLWVYGIPESFLVERLMIFVGVTGSVALVVLFRYEILSGSAKGGNWMNDGKQSNTPAIVRSLALCSLIVMVVVGMQVAPSLAFTSHDTSQEFDNISELSSLEPADVAGDTVIIEESNTDVIGVINSIDSIGSDLLVSTFEGYVYIVDSDTLEIKNSKDFDSWSDIDGPNMDAIYYNGHIYATLNDNDPGYIFKLDTNLNIVDHEEATNLNSIHSAFGYILAGGSSVNPGVFKYDTDLNVTGELSLRSDESIDSFAEDDEYLYVGAFISGSVQYDEYIYKVNPHTMEEVDKYVHWLRPQEMIISDGELFYDGEDDINVLNTDTMEKVDDVEGAEQRGLDYDGDGLALGSFTGTVYKIGTETNELLGESEVLDSTSGIHYVNDNWYLVGSSDDRGLYLLNPTPEEVSGFVTNPSGEVIEGATISSRGQDATTNENGTYSLYLDDGVQDTIIEANTSIDSDATLASVPNVNVNFTLADGDIGGQVLACDATDIHCSDPSPLPNATVEIMGLDHLEIENYFDDVDSPEEAEAKAEELLEEARTWNIDDWESGLDVFDDIVDEEPNANYAMMHTPEDWGIQGDSQLTDRIVAGERPDLENPVVQIQPGEEVILSVWDPAKESSSWRDWFFSDFASEEAVGSPVEGTVEISQLGPGGESMGTAGVPVETDIQYVDVAERVGIITGTVEVPVRSHRFSEGYYRVSVDGSPAEYIIQVGDPDVEELFPSYFTDIEDEAGELTEIAKELNELQDANVLEVKTVQANEEGRWSADLPDTTETVGVTAWKGPQDLLDPEGDAVQAQLMELQREAFNILETDGIDAIDDPDIEDIGDIMASDTYSISDVVDELDDNALEGTVFDESIYAPREPVETDVPSQIDIETTRIGATSFIDPLHYDSIFESQLEDFIDEWLEELLNEWDFPLEEIEDLEELDELLEELLEDQENLIKEIEELEELIEELENADGELTEEELEELLEELELDVELEGVEELAELIEELGDLFDSEDDEPEELLDKIAALEAMIEELRERVNDGGGEISNGEYFGEFHFPGEIDEDSVSARVYFQSHPQYDDGDIGIFPIPGQHFAMVPDEYITVSSSVNPFDDGQTVVIDGFPIPDGQAVADVRVDATVDDTPVRNEDSTTNPAFDGDIPGLESIDLSSLRPAPDDSVRISLNADPARYDRIVDIVAYDPEGNRAATDIDRLNDQAFVTMNGTGGHWVELTYQSTSGHNFTHSFQIGARDQAGTPGPTIQFDRSVEGLIGMAGEGVEAVDVDKRPGHPTQFEVVSRDSDISDLHVRTLDQFDSTDFSLEVVSGDDRVAVTRHVTVYFHHSVDEDALLWRGGSAVPKDGNVLGEYLSDDGVIVTYTDDTGQVDVSIVRDPGILDRASHWINLQRQSLPLLSLIPPLVLLVPVVLRRRWFA